MFTDQNGAGEKKTRSWAVGGERVEATAGIGRMDGLGVWHTVGVCLNKRNVFCWS